LSYLLGEHIHLGVELCLLRLHLGNKLFFLLIKENVLSCDLLNGLLGRSKHTPSLICIFLFCEGILEVVEHIINVGALLDINLLLLDGNGNLGHVLSNLTEFLNVSGNSHDLDVHVVDVEHDLVGLDLGLSCDDLDFLTSNLEMLLAEVVSDSFRVD
jgi:hypothetical protein